jgi:hypothetical protein
MEFVDGETLETLIRRRGSAEVTQGAAKRKPRKQAVRWAVAAGLCFAGLLIAWFFLSGRPGLLFNWRATEAVTTEKSVAVLPFESLSESKSDAYFADGVQDEILNNLAKIAQLKVISRTSVMQYRGARSVIYVKSPAPSVWRMSWKERSVVTVTMCVLVRS